MISNDKDKRKKIRVEGWVEDDELISNIPTVCPKCGSKLRIVNALQSEARIIFIYCPNSKCRYAEEYEE
jgi:hypothetical protein